MAVPKLAFMYGNRAITYANKLETQLAQQKIYCLNTLTSRRTFRDASSRRVKFGYFAHIVDMRMLNQPMEQVRARIEKISKII